MTVKELKKLIPHLKEHKRKGKEVMIDFRIENEYEEYVNDWGLKEVGDLVKQTIDIHIVVKKN